MKNLLKTGALFALFGLNMACTQTPQEQAAAKETKLKLAAHWAKQHNNMTQNMPESIGKAAFTHGVDSTEVAKLVLGN